MGVLGSFFLAVSSAAVNRMDRAVPHLQVGLFQPEIHFAKFFNVGLDAQSWTTETSASRRNRN